MTHCGSSLFLYSLKRGTIIKLLIKWGTCEKIDCGTQLNTIFTSDTPILIMLPRAISISTVYQFVLSAIAIQGVHVNWSTTLSKVSPIEGHIKKSIYDDKERTNKIYIQNYASSHRVSYPS